MMTTHYSKLGLPDYTQVLKGVEPSVKKKFYEDLLNGRKVPNQSGQQQDMPGLNDQLLEAIADARSFEDALNLRSISIREANLYGELLERGEAELAMMAYEFAVKTDRLSTIMNEVVRIQTALEELRTAGSDIHVGPRLG